MKTYIIIVYASQIALYSNCELYTYARATAAPRCERVDCNRAIRKPYFFIFHPKVSFRRRQSLRERIITPPKMLIMFMRVHFFSILHSSILSSGRTPQGFLWLHNSSGLSYSICYSNLPALRFVWLLSVTCVRVCFSATPRLCVLFNALTMGLFTASSITRLTVVGLFVDDVEWIEYVLSGLLERERQSERKITTN